MPEVQIVQPDPVVPKAGAPEQGTARKRPPARAAPAPAPKPQPKPAQPPPAPPAPVAPADPAPVTSVKLSPVGGSEIAIEKVAGSVSTVSATDVARGGASSIQDVLAANVPGVSLNDLQGSGFQTDIQYRGFSASPVDGVAQGLAIYQNGVRINEAFGDTINFDFLPSNAIDGLTVMSNNPAFGLNAIGGAISIGMKDGFSYQGGEIDGRLGSFGRRQGSVQAGMKQGAAAAYFAYEDISDDGWRDNSPARIRRFYGDVGFKADGNELHVNLTRANNFYGVVTAAPIQLLEQGGWGRTYTSPQTTTNDVVMPTVNASVALNDATKLSGVAYYRAFSQRKIDANLTNAVDCGNGFLCIGANLDPVLDQNGNPVAAANVAGVPYSSEIDRSSIDSDSYGGSAQVVNKDRLFGRPNQFLMGVSLDHGVTAYKTSAEFGTIDPATFFITVSGIIASAPFDLSPRNVRGTNDYAGVFFSNALDVTDAFTLTVGGRFNSAKIALQDLTGAPQAAGLNGTHTYERFNPMIGGTYQIVRGLTVYGGYSEANRAPTIAELSCSDPNNPCVISTFLTSDPELKQVVARTVEGGLRGDVKSMDQRVKVDWTLGLFRTLNSDDILPIASVAQARGYFANAGETLRQGLEASVSYRNDRLMAYGSYNYVAATFETAQTFASPNNPQNPDSAQPFFINVRPGDKIPNIPAHKFKAGLDYWMTPQWKLGADMVAQTDQFFRGDENNQNKPLSGFATFNLHTSYDLNKNLQFYGLINNVFDDRHATYGTYVNLSNANGIGNAIQFSDPRSITPATPFAAYGGLKVRF